MGQLGPKTQSSALGHLRALEVGDEIGEFCGKLLADMGADVIRVEPPQGSATRNIGPFLDDEPGPERSLHFWHYNTNKRSVTLDLDMPAGRQMLLRLAEQANILVESFPSGYMEERGISFQELRKVNPRLVYVSISAFGRGGPRGNFKGGDLEGWAASGYMQTTGWTWQRPTRPWGRQAAHIGSLYAVSAALAAVSNCWRTGKGEQVDISLQEAVASTVEHDVAFYVGDKVISGRRDNDHVNVFGSTKLLRCKDGWVHLNIGWRNGRNAIVEWMNDEEMAGDLTDEKWQDNAYRRANVKHVVDVVTKWATTRTRQEFFHEGQKRGLECGPINSIPDALDDPQLRSRDFWVEVEHPEFDRSFTYPGAPYQLTETPWAMRRRAPQIGEDNDAIYTQDLGLSEGDLSELTTQGVI